MEIFQGVQKNSWNTWTDIFIHWIVSNVYLLTFLTYLYKKLPVLWQFFVFYFWKVIHQILVLGTHSWSFRIYTNAFFIIKHLFIHSQIVEWVLSGDSLFFYVSVILFLKKERLQYLMGHANISTTLDVYVHVNTDDVRAAVNKVTEMAN